MGRDYRLLWLAVVLFSLIPVAPARASLTEAPRLAAIYDTILDAQFERADAELKQACPPAPAEACQALTAVAIWWQILVNPESHLLDARLTQAANAAIAASSAWTAREPQRAEAWFYLAGSYAPLVQLRILRGERLAAAKDGNRIRQALERALSLDPTLDDAYFGIGLYHYYADVAPTAAKILRFFLMLPGGDRAKGLQEMLTARQHGELMRGEADYQLQLVYLWYERQPAKALELLDELEQRYPANPLFLERIADVQQTYFHDLPASAGAWERLLERARAGKVAFAHSSEIRARLGLAAALDAMDDTDRAIEELEAVIDAQPQVPVDARARAQLQLGAACDRIGDRHRAVAAYTAAAIIAPSEDATGVRDRARAALDAPAPDPRAARAYRDSLDGWRALQHGDAAAAEPLLARAVAVRSQDPVARYRWARALDALGQHEAARAELERIIAARPVPPAFVLASAYVDCARLVEHDGDRERARELYTIGASIAGGDPHARDLARRAMKRLAASRNF